MKLRNVSIGCLGAAVFMGLGASAGASDKEIPGEPMPRDAVVCADLRDVRAQPHAYYKTKFRFEGRFHGLGEVFQPFFTIFDSFEHANFRAWDRCADLRDKEDYADSFGLLYVARRSGAAMEHLGALKRFQRFEAVAVVQSIFDGRPFVEVIDIVPQDCHYSCSQHRDAAFGNDPADPSAPQDSPAASTATPAPAAVRDEEEAAATH